MTGATISGVGGILGLTGSVNTNASATTSYIIPPISLGASNITITTALGSTVSGIDLSMGGGISGTGSLTKAGPGTLTLTAAASTYTGATNINGGVLSISADGNLGADPSSATPGNITFGGGTLATAASFALNSNRGISITTSGTIDVASGRTLTYGGIFAGGSLISTDNGTLSLGSANSTLSNLTINSGNTFVSTSGNLNLTGNFSNSGTFTHNSGTVTFNGTSAQTMGGFCYFNNLTLSNTAGLSLTSAETVLGNLNFATNGLITLGAYNLNLSGLATITGAGSSAYVVTNGAGYLVRDWGGTGTFVYPVGDNTSNTDYTPMSVTFTAGTFLGFPGVGVQSFNSKESNNTSPANYLNRYWNFSGSSLGTFSATLQGTYLAGDVAGTETSINTGLWDGSTWTQYGTVDNTNHQLNATVTSFGDITGVNFTPPLSVTVPTQTDVICNGSFTGVANAVAAGGTTPYTYTWTPSGGNGATASNLSATTYTITVQDAASASATASVTITQPAGLADGAPIHNSDASCHHGAGSATAATPTGGTPPYTYQWNGGSSSTNATNSNLFSGTYTVNVTDAHGCKVNSSSSVTITEPIAYLADFTPTHNSDASCNGGTGSATAATPFGGTAPYTYQWNGGSSSTNATNSTLSAGTYTVNVTDAHGCTVNAFGTVIITEPNVLADGTPTINSNILCYGSLGSATAATPTGGTAPYTYQWNGGSSSTNATNSSLSAGTYTVNVTDAHGCTVNSSGTVTINGPSSALAEGTPTLNSNISCVGGNGSATAATPTGGTAPYTYQWNGGTSSTSATNTALSAGTYTVNVTDAHGCTTNSSGTVTITEPNLLTITVTSQTAITCHGGSDGAGTVQGWGGTTPYNYSWNSGPTSTSGSMSGLTAGVYTVTVTDANGCQAQHTVGLHQPSPMRDSIVSSKTVNVKCNGVFSGFATVGVAYGTAPYTYTWSNGVTVAPIYTLSAGTYTVTVSDNCGASGTASVTITQPSTAVSETVTVNKNVTCYGGNDGAATSNPSGGTTPYSYLWNTGQTTQVVTTGFTAAGHICTLKDNNGCSIAASATITQPTVITATFVQTKPLCYASADGSITATGHGGSGNYTGYLWSNSQATQTATGISAGTYTVKVTDNNGCSGSSTSTLTSPAVVTPNAITGPVCVTGGGKGTITCSPTGGTRPYSFVWSNSTVSKGNYSPVTVPDGSYTVSITDANNCPTVYASISFSSCPVIRPRNGADQVSPESGLMNINVYPNPSNGQFTIQWSVVSGQWSVEIYNVLGEKVYSQSNIQNSASNINLTSQSNGIYLIRILDKDGNLISQKKVVKTN